MASTELHLSSMPRAQLLLGFLTLLLLIAASAAMLGYLPPLQIAGAPPQLKVSISPDGIPMSGGWTVRTCLFYGDNNTCFSVDSIVKMTALLEDGTYFVQAKKATLGQVEFQAAPGTSAVRFDASYNDSTGAFYLTPLQYTGFATVSSPSLISSGEGWGLLLYAISAGSAFLTATCEKIWRIRALRRKSQALLILGLLTTLILPCAYIIAEVPAWFGKLWLPASLGVIPLWAFPVLSAVPAGIAAAPFAKAVLERRGTRHGGA